MKVMMPRIILTSFIVLISIVPIFADELEPAGRVLTRQDWIDFMPVLIASIAIMLIVNACFIAPIFRKNKNEMRG